MAPFARGSRSGALLACWVLVVGSSHAFRPAAGPSVVDTSRGASTMSSRSTIITPPLQQLNMVSIGLGPDEKKTEDKPKVEGVDYVVPNHEEHRLDRRSKIDEQCDVWFEQLLGSPDNVGKQACKGSIAEAVYKTLTEPVELVNDIQKPFDDDEWTPYVSTKLPWSVLHPAYGLEKFGLPVPRRNAETWRHFDVSGMVNTMIDGDLKASLDAVDSKSLQDKLVAAGTWLDDDECSARLVYINGEFVNDLSIESDAAKNYQSSDSLSDEMQTFLGRLTDGWTDELLCPVPMQQGDPLTSYQKLSGPNHNVGPPSSQFAINTQQGTACFVALNTLQCSNIAIVHETEKYEGEEPPTKPVLIVNALTSDGGVKDAESDMGVATYPRTVIVAEEGTHASVVQHSVTLTDSDEKPRPTLYNGYTQILLKDNANVTHSLVEETGGMPVPGVEKADEEAREAEASRAALQNTVLENLDVHCAGSESHYSGTVLSMGGTGRTRLATSISLLKPGSSCSLLGFSLAGGNCRADIKTSIHHIADGCSSEQLQKNMVAGRATSSFRGRIRVEQSAQQTDSRQLSRTVLLTDKARAWAVPSLEIIADDVQCTHGATVSDLSEEELFYLRSRGLDVASARNLLMFAFCNDVTVNVPETVLGEFKALDSADAEAASGKAKREGLQLRILRRLKNLVPTGERAVSGEFQSV